MRNIKSFLGHTKKDVKIDYAGRPIAAATAVGFAKTHNAQLAALLDQALA
jgi:2-oxoglutarate dehydrogenase complex dehydrogenase (E1) component-like enzyme